MRFCDLKVGDKFKFGFDQDSLLMDLGLDTRLYSYEKIAEARVRTLTCPPERDCVGEEYDIEISYYNEVILL